jgi:tetratricopeptide (TPR) repeat protein
MATDPAPPAPPRRLWQLPTFLVGLAALVALWHHGHRLRPSVADRYERAIVALRPAVDRQPPDFDQLQAALRKVPDADPPADKATLVRYLTGSAYVAVAEATPAAEAGEWWARARHDLEAVTAKELSAQDQKRLRYRLARTWYHSPGVDRKRTIEALSQSLAGGDDPSEGYRLLAVLYRDGPEADATKERDSLRNFLKHATTRADARTLNEARVRLAGLHAKLGEGEEARKVLERVGPEAPPEVYAAARLQLAGFLQAEQDWTAAAQMWEQVRDMKAATDAQRAEARVRLAEAYVKLGRPGDAEKAVEDGMTDGAETPGILFQRAKLRLADAAAPRDAVVRDLEAAFAGSDPEAVRRLVPPAEARKVCEEAFEKAKAAGEFALAVRAAGVYARVAEGGAEHRLLVDAHAGWAAAATGDEAREHFRAAATACEAAGRADATPAGRGDWLRKAAGLYLKAGDRAKGLAVLGDLTTRLPDYPEDRAGQAWAEMGDIYLAAGDRDQARLAFQNAAGRPGPAQDRARVRCAALFHDADPARGGPAAAALLEEVAGRPADAKDPSAHEEAVFLLGEVYLLQKEWAKAADRLRVALATYPESPRGGRGRYHLGQVLRHVAYDASRQIKADRAGIQEIKKVQLERRQPAYKVDELLRLEDSIERSEKAFQAQMRGAYDEFRKAADLFPTTADADPDTVRRAAFWAADCAFWLGEYADGAVRCEALRTRFSGHVEALEAGRDLYRCCVYAAEAARDGKDPTAPAAWAKRAADARTQVQAALARVPAAEFDGVTETHKRSYWDGWLAETGPK